MAKTVFIHKPIELHRNKIDPSTKKFAQGGSMELAKITDAQAPVKDVSMDIVSLEKKDKAIIAKIDELLAKKNLTVYDYTKGSDKRYYGTVVPLAVESAGCLLE